MMSRLFTENLAQLTSRRPKTVIAVLVVALVLVKAAGSVLTAALKSAAESMKQPASVSAEEPDEERPGPQKDTSVEGVDNPIKVTKGSFTSAVPERG